MTDHADTIRRDAERLSGICSVRQFTPEEAEQAVNTLLEIPVLLAERDEWKLSAGSEAELANQYHAELLQAQQQIRDNAEGANDLLMKCLAERQQAQEERDKAYDQGVDSVWMERVCSVCGKNHDRDESAMCAGGEVLSFEDWVAWVQMDWVPQRRQAVDALRWYADEANYDFDGPDHDSAIQAYGQERATAVLVKLGEA